MIHVPVTPPVVVDRLPYVAIVHGTLLAVWQQQHLEENYKCDEIVSLNFCFLFAQSGQFFIHARQRFSAQLPVVYGIVECAV